MPSSSGARHGGGFDPGGIAKCRRWLHRAHDNSDRGQILRSKPDVLSVVDEDLRGRTPRIAVSVLGVGVNPVDYKLYSGTMGNDPGLPCISVPKPPAWSPRSAPTPLGRRDPLTWATRWCSTGLRVPTRTMWWCRREPRSRSPNPQLRPGRRAHVDRHDGHPRGLDDLGASRRHGLDRRASAAWGAWPSRSPVTVARGSSAP